MKLELKHLAPYLPYGLIVEFEGTNGMIASFYFPAGRKFGMPPHEAWFNSGILSLEDVDKDSELSCAINYKQIKPILHPLSDLTKEIEHNGEKFVPMVELLKVRHPYDDYNSKYGEIDCEQYPSTARAYYKYRANYSISVFTLQLSSEKHWIVQKLFEWHFDVFGLIDKGLAIEKPKS